MADGDVRDVDAVVLGLGVAGEEVAGRLARAGLRTVGVEPHLVGGECPYYACVPSKMMLRAASALAEAHRVSELAGRATVVPDYSTVAARIRAEATDNWDDTVAVERFTNAGGEFVRGAGRIEGPGLVRVGDTVYRAGRAIVVATGTAPAIPPIPGLARIGYWTNRQMARAEKLPPSLIVLGGGPVGVELAQVAARFGCRVTLVEALDRVLPHEEPEASAAVRDALVADGVSVRCGFAVESVSVDGDGVRARLDDGSSVTARRILLAVGRRPNLTDIGLETIGLGEHHRTLPNDERMRVTDGVWAVGDVTGRGLFTHVGVAQARVAAADILGEPVPPMEYHGLAWATFTDPEVGRVGLTERAAAEAGVAVRVGQVATAETSRGWIHGPGNDGLIKLVADADSDRLVGATSVGPAGGEVLGALALAVHGRVPLDTLRTAHYAYPTFHRGVLDALAALDG